MKSLSSRIPLESLPNTLSKVFVKGVFTLTVFKILLYVGRMILSPVQRGIGSERVKYV